MKSHETKADVDTKTFPDGSALKLVSCLIWMMMIMIIIIHSVGSTLNDGRSIICCQLCAVSCCLLRHSILAYVNDMISSSYALIIVILFDVIVLILLIVLPLKISVAIDVVLVTIMAYWPDSYPIAFRTSSYYQIILKYLSYRYNFLILSRQDNHVISCHVK